MVDGIVSLVDRAATGNLSLTPITRHISSVCLPSVNLYPHPTDTTFAFLKREDSCFFWVVMILFMSMLHIYTIFTIIPFLDCIIRSLVWR